MSEIDPVLEARNRIGNAVKHGNSAGARVARQDLAAARVRRAVLADRNGMRAEQRQALADLLVAGVTR
ncbi:hypothetical protein [Quadrisphaera sp. INWT6]|uniref:hypothetical protein n=1 Tax=Quadrisphaera sp. INWT6 TaxID=2596917 RepID=UPI0018927BE4|nr:hypothetical protein [Quadrisphaera sp. INWT6]MBF5081382.1 hypothetical protein [Quadrisphaera sp. INWT6]